MIYFLLLIMCVGQSLDPVCLFPVVAAARADCWVVIFLAVDSFVSLTDVSVTLCRSTRENPKPCPCGSMVFFFGDGKSCKHLFSFCEVPVIEISVLVFASSFIILYGELKVGQTWDSWNISMLIAELHLCKAGFSPKWENTIAICCLCI